MIVLNHPGETAKRGSMGRPSPCSRVEIIAAPIRRLQEHCKSLTAPYKYPREIAFVDSLLKTSTGKIRRSELREMERAANA